MENQLLQGNLAVSGFPCWRSNTIVNNILYFILVSWITKWRTNCFRGTKKLQFCVMDLQMENQLFQGNQEASSLNHGSPNEEPTVSGEPRSFNFEAWISKWRTNCFRGTKKLQFCIMDLQMENQLFQGNQETSILNHGSPNGEPTVTRKPSSVRFSMLEIQYCSE